MKRNVVWLIPGLLAMSTVLWAPACSSSDDDGSASGDDAATGLPETGAIDSSVADTSVVVTDANTNDASTEAEASTEAGVVDPYVAACARIDACATATTPRIGMNGCYRLITAAPFGRTLDAKDRAQLENLECKLAAKTCTAVRACDKPLADYVALCQQKEGGDHCAGNVHVVCDDNTFAPVAVSDCAATGAICGGDSGFYSGCGIQACTPGETAATCAGDVLTQCQGTGVTNKVDCKTANQLVLVKPAGKRTIAGTTCGLDQNAENDCIGTGAACTGFMQRCDGTVLETCAGGKLARRDCATVTPAGQGCVTLAEGPDRIVGALGCGPVNPTCHPTDNETCDSTTSVIGFCALTGPKTVDCKALGYAGCKTTPVDGRVTASCF